MKNIYQSFEKEKFKSTLKETSKDNSNIARGSVKYMTDSEKEVVNFDVVKKDYVENLGLSIVPKSNDALLIVDDKVSFFIEFKNGSINNEKTYEIQKKIYDSLLLILDLIDNSISFSRKYLHYILVYNEELSHPSKLFDEEEFVKRNNEYKLYRDKIVKRVKLLSANNYIQFGLGYFEKIYFKSVNTFTKKEFDYWISNKLYKQV